MDIKYVEPQNLYAMINILLTGEKHSSAGTSACTINHVYSNTDSKTAV